MSDDTVLPCGMVIWSAGVAAAPLTKALPFPKAKNGNLKTNAYCQVCLIADTNDSVYVVD